MPDFSALLQQGAGHAWLFIPSAMLLGALHGLEPGHSKTMMAAFIIAVRGTIGQAVMLGLAATVSHTAVVWAVALIGMHFGGTLDAEASEPYFQVASAAMIVAVALWMVWRTWRSGEEAHHHHDHDDESKHVDTGQGSVRLDIFEDGVPPRFRLFSESGRQWKADEVSVSIERGAGVRESFAFVERDGFIESVEEIAEPHAFTARLTLGDEGHTHDYDLVYAEHDHGHSHAGNNEEGLDLALVGYQDAHERAHANDIERRFARGHVTNGQILAFGLTGGLIPCPAAITVLLLCLQLKKVTLGATLVLSFSVGLAVTMVLSGVIAAVSIKHVTKHATKRWSGFGELARKAPYFSSALILLVGLYVGFQGAQVLLAR